MQPLFRLYGNQFPFFTKAYINLGLPATWVHIDGRHFGKYSRRTTAPSANILNKMITTYWNAAGWIHHQNNLKIKRNDDEDDQLLTAEKGINTYEKVDNSRYDAAKLKWEQSNKFWQDVRIIWDEIFKQNKNISLNRKVNDKLLYEVLFDMSDASIATKNGRLGRKIRPKLKRSFHNIWKRNRTL